MQRLEVSGAVRPIYGSLGVKRLIMLWKCSGFNVGSLIVSAKLYEVWTQELIVSLMEYGVMCSIFRYIQPINWGCQLIRLTHFLFCVPF